MPRSKPSSGGRPWGVIQHVAWEGPGTIADEAAARGIRLDLRRMDRGEPVPTLEEISGLVVMGGPMSAHDTATHPHLAHERRLLRDAMERDLPVLAVCLGSQLLALALDARVERGPMPEIGIGEVALTAEGREDPVLGLAGESVPVVHWHEDTFHVPDGAVHLAESALYRNQAFRLGDRAYAFQFHLEVDRALAGAWEGKLPPGIQLTEDRRVEVERAGRSILGRFFDRALGKGT